MSELSDNVEAPIEGTIESVNEDLNEDDEELNSSVNKIKKHKRLLLDSESENEDEMRLELSPHNDQINNSNDSEKSPVSKKKHKRLVMDSESEDETQITHDKSEDETQITPHNKSYTDDTSTDGGNVAPIYTTNAKGELTLENEEPQKSRLSALCDPESSDEETTNSQDNPPQNDKSHNSSDDEDSIKPVIYKRKSTKKDKENDEPKKMTGKEAAEQRREIQSESQRMLRESNVSLPYHKPKSHSLREFLARRSKFKSALPIKSSTPPSVAIKMSIEQLKIVSKQIEERAKEAKEFFKSESEESEDDDDKDYVPEDDAKEEPNKAIETENHDETVKNDGETLENNDKIIENEVETVENDGKTDETVISDDKVNIIDDKSDTNENRTVTNEEETIVNDQKTVIDDSNVMIIDNIIIKPADKTVEDEIENETAMETDDQTPTANKDRQSMDFEFNLDDVEESEPLKTSEDYYNLSDDENKVESRKSVLEMLKEKLANTTPKLSGDPEQIIDLESGVTKPNEVAKLMERFAQHTATKKHNKHKVKLSVVSVSGGEVLNETVSMTVDDDENVSVIEEKPGARLKRLKKELQEQMEQKRSEQWKKKVNETVGDEGKVEDGVKDDYEEDALLDNEDEEEFTESETEEEEEEDDVVVEDKPQRKSEFVDEEAEDDDDEMSENDKDDIESDTTSQQSKYSDVYETVNDIFPKKKPLKRIKKGFTEDSDDDDDDELDTTVKLPTKDDTLVINDEDAPPPHQPEPAKTPQKNLIKEKSNFEFLTPITFMTGLQNLNTKAKESPIAGLNPELGEPSPFKDPNWHTDVQKKLFSDSQSDEADLTNESQNLDELAGMCSAEFPITQKPQETQEVPSTQDLVNVCSGSFTPLSYEINPTNEIKSLDEDQDLLISQLLDEEEMENFKKKFESTQESEAEEVTGTGGVIDSDDENEDETNIKKKQKRKLVFSDDENSDEDEASEEEQIDLHDEDEEEVEDNRQVDYDSEENEVVYKPSEFLDKEAELSESEWGSADEDENEELDILETEKGDSEKFDENKLRSDLERIHMRQILDEDNRDIKYLQELLLEDGELHGSGRQRQFKWKNIDSVDEGEEKKTEDDDVYMDEEESEEQWRKKRHEREMFLKEQLAKKALTEDDDDLVTNSQILKLGQKAILKSGSGSQTLLVEEKAKVVQSNKPFNMLLQSKRGSFLSRSEQVLQKLAEYNKVSTTVVGAATAKNSRNFVFQTVSQVETTTSIIQEKKRKATEGTPNVLKKLRLSSNFSPLAGKKKLTKPDRAKKLFGGQ